MKRREPPEPISVDRLPAGTSSTAVDAPPLYRVHPTLLRTGSVNDMTRTEVLEKHPPRMENVLLILHDLQAHNPRNYLSKTDLEQAAGYLNTTQASIYGIASYYSLFSLTPRGRHIIRICRSPVCRMGNDEDVFNALHRMLNIDIGQTTPDGRFTLETAECLGHCDRAPVMAVDESIYGDLTPDRIEAVIQDYREKKQRVRRSDR